MNKEIILTLDAGGTNFIFSAMRNYQEIVKPTLLPSNAHDLSLCLSTIVSGFEKIIEAINEKPAAISFAFPGPADYKNGVIGELNNLPAFKGGVALGPMLEERFRIPVFINNDGDLFALGEALNGFLPFINNELSLREKNKKFNNLIGVTLGTGFGAGIVINNELLLGDNSNGAEIWLMRDGLKSEQNVEEAVSARAVVREYAKETGLSLEKAPNPEAIYNIAVCAIEGDMSAAKKSFELFGKSIGEALANVVTLIDGIVVIGGGLSNAHKMFMPHLIEQMNSCYNLDNGQKLNRLVQHVFPATNEKEVETFCDFDAEEVKIPFTEKKVFYNKDKRICVGLSKLGTSNAVAVGAYEFAINMLKSNE